MKILKIFHILHQYVFKFCESIIIFLFLSYFKCNYESFCILPKFSLHWVFKRFLHLNMNRPRIDGADGVRNIIWIQNRNHLPAKWLNAILPVEQSHTLFQLVHEMDSPTPFLILDFHMQVFIFFYPIRTPQWVATVAVRTSPPRHAHICTPPSLRVRTCILCNCVCAYFTIFNLHSTTPSLRTDCIVSVLS